MDKLDQQTLLTWSDPYVALTLLLAAAMFLERTVSQAYFALHETLHEVQKFKEKNIFWY
jgi:hypothetical protein